MHSIKIAAALLFATFMAFPGRTAHGQTLKIAGASSVSLPLMDAAEILKKDQNITLEVHTEGGSSTWGIAALGLNDVDVAMSSRFVTPEERAQYPSANFIEVYFGEEACALVVSQDVWDGGVRVISKAQAKAIYEGRTRNWKDLGGPDLAITGYTAEQGRSVWACYIQWIYDDPTKARRNRFATVSSDSDAKSYLEATPGSIAQVSMRFADEKNLYKLAIAGSDGASIPPSVASVAAHKYPMSRPLFMIANGRPLAAVKTLVEFMLGAQGQELVHKYHYLTLKDLGVAPQTFE